MLLASCVGHPCQSPLVPEIAFGLRELQSPEKETDGHTGPRDWIVRGRGSPTSVHAIYIATSGIILLLEEPGVKVLPFGLDCVEFPLYPQIPTGKTSRSRWLQMAWPPAEKA